METSQSIEAQPQFKTVPFLQAGTILMVHVRPSQDITADQANFLIGDLNVDDKKKRSFVAIILKEDLRMNLHGVTQGKLQDCECSIPALSAEAKSVNSAFTAISREYEKYRTGPGGSVFIKVFYEDKDNLWKPLSKLRDQIDKTYDSEIKKNFRTAFFKLSRVDKVDVLSNLLEWLVRKDSSEQILDSLKRLDVDSLQTINTLIGVSNLKKVLNIWENNQSNSSEEFWQTTLTEHSYVLSQLFSSPVILFRGKAYIGGKGLSNTGGKFVDFLYTNDLTKNVALIEIKTPETKLIGSVYRDVFPPSNDISGAILQLTNYRNMLVQKFDSLIRKEDDLEMFSPTCLLIAGNLTKELKDKAKQGSFEMYRSTLKDVQLTTFDELFRKVKILVDLLEGI
jgi:hypothetical protein